MLAIAYREFKDLFKSVRSLIVVTIILGVTFGSAKVVSIFQDQAQELGLGRGGNNESGKT